MESIELSKKRANALAARQTRVIHSKSNHQGYRRHHASIIWWSMVEWWIACLTITHRANSLASLITPNFDQISNENRAEIDCNCTDWHIDVWWTWYNAGSKALLVMLSHRSTDRFWSLKRHQIDQRWYLDVLATRRGDRTRNWMQRWRVGEFGTPRERKSNSNVRCSQTSWQLSVTVNYTIDFWSSFLNSWINETFKLFLAC
jgi:hypothetical protein